MTIYIFSYHIWACLEENGLIRLPNQRSEGHQDSRGRCVATPKALFFLFEKSENHLKNQQKHPKAEDHQGFVAEMQRLALQKAL